jgi:glycosyltransferase 2 family protein
MVLLAPVPVRVPARRPEPVSPARPPVLPVTAAQAPVSPARLPVTAAQAPVAPAQLPADAAPARPGRSWQVGRWVGAGLLLTALTMLALQLRDADLGAAFAAVQPGMLAVALGWYALSLLAAAYTVTGFSPLPLQLRTTVLAQLAVGGLRLLVPSAAGMPAVIVRYLTRSGASVGDAAATVAAGQAAQLVATAAVVAALGAGSGTGVARPDGTVTLIALGVLAGLALVGWIAARVSGRVRAGIAATWRGQVTLAQHARRHPGRVAAGMLASAALTLFHVLAFAACVSAAGGSLPLVTLAAVYLGAATAGSLVPTPGGIGPVEAALVAGLTAAGMPLPAATAAALLSRLVSVWLPAVPGLAAAAVLRRRALL